MSSRKPAAGSKLTGNLEPLQDSDLIFFMMSCLLLERVTFQEIDLVTISVSCRNVECNRYVGEALSQGR
jgi:hypothetical protein